MNIEIKKLLRKKRRKNWLWKNFVKEFMNFLKHVLCPKCDKVLWKIISKEE